MSEKIQGHPREDLLAMDISALRTLLHERTHHTLEVVLYRILKGRLKKPDHFGDQVKALLAIWKERGLPIHTPDLQWSMRYLEIAERLNAGETVELDTELPKPFSEGEMETVRKLLYERRSIRQFTDQPVPEWMVKEMLLAGLMSPQACNVDSRRFLVLQKPDEWKLLKSDIPITAGVMIVVCQEMVIYDAVRSIAERSPQNIYYDAACAADHICLMAHALGLGACWLTHGEETQKKIRDYFGLPDTLVSRCHIIVGWPDEAPIKSQRMALDDAIIKKKEGPGVQSDSSLFIGLVLLQNLNDILHVAQCQNCEQKYASFHNTFPPPDQFTQIFDFKYKNVLWGGLIVG